MVIDFSRLGGVSSWYKNMKSIEAMKEAADTIGQRGKDYDKPEGERSMAATVAAFNAITGKNLDESDGWLFMLLLKQVRQWQKPEFHRDSAIDGIAYAALLAESLSDENDKP